IGLYHRRGKDQLRAGKSKLLRLLRFVADVDLGGGIVADADDRETWPQARARQLGADLRLDLRRHGLAVDELCGHGLRFYHESDSPFADRRSPFVVRRGAVRYFWSPRV